MKQLALALLWNEIQKPFRVLRAACGSGRSGILGVTDGCASARSLQAIIGIAGTSSEFINRYGGRGNSEPSAIYRRALHAEPDPAGLAVLRPGGFLIGWPDVQAITLDVLNQRRGIRFDSRRQQSWTWPSYYTTKVAGGCYGSEQDGVNMIFGVTASPAASVTAARAISACGT